MQSEINISKSLSIVQAQVLESKARRPVNLQNQDVCIVAVSKTKPKSAILEAYNCGCRHFGENYVNELSEKANDPEILEMCSDIKWHFIGHLQSNKVNKLLGAANLFMVQTIDTAKLADCVEKAWAKLLKAESLNIMVQVNTSQEDNKSGTSLENAADLVKHIIDHCPHLRVKGIMMIGYAHHDLELGPNPDFLDMVKCRDQICKDHSLESLNLSMGMSQDFEHAIEMGSNCVRIGSSVFGARTPKSAT